MKAVICKTIEVVKKAKNYMIIDKVPVQRFDEYTSCIIWCFMVA